MNDLFQHFSSLKKPKEIFDFVERLSLEDLKNLLLIMEQKEPAFQDQILSTFNGIPPAHFMMLADLAIFQKYAKHPSLQQKLESAAPHFKKILAEYSDDKKTLDLCIEELPLLPVNAALLGSISEQVIQLSDKIKRILSILDPLLQLSWLSENPSLIDTFSSFKTHFLELDIQEDQQPTRLIERLNSIFGKDDTASCLQGLAALGIKDKEGMMRLGAFLNLKNLSKASIGKAIQLQLQEAGLSTVKDFKTHKIYTESHLLGFLKKTD